MKYVAIRKEPNGSLYMDKNFFKRFADNELGVYNFQKIQLTDEEFSNISIEDFVFDEKTGCIYFSTELQSTRLTNEQELKELPKLREEMSAISQDIIQMLCGADFPDKEERLERFRVAHNRYREIVGKEPRIYNTGENKYALQ